jgi:hypothetical protein
MTPGSPGGSTRRSRRYARPVTYEALRSRGLLTRVRELRTLPIRSQM